jgi:hypothetical protein
MPIRLKLDFPNVVEVMRQLGTSAATAQTRAMADVVDGWKVDIRQLVKANFKRTPAAAKRRGLNFEKSFQGTAYPRKGKASFDPAGFLNAKANFAEVFEDGGTSAPKGRYLAIALPAAKKLGLDYDPSSGHLQKRSMVEAAEARFGKLRPIPSKAGNIVLAADTLGKRRGGSIAQYTAGKFSQVRARGKKRDFIPLFVLVKSVRLPKKLRFVEIAQRWLNRLPAFTEKRAAEIMAKGKP